MFWIGLERWSGLERGEEGGGTGSLGISEEEEGEGGGG